MPSFLTSIVLEFAEEDLSDTTPTWVNVTDDFLEGEWWAGVGSEGSDPEAGGCRLVMRNRNRRWEPDYVAGQFYPNITTHRRFRLTLDDAVGAAVQQGLWYVTDIQVEWPLDTEHSIVTFTCGDGFEVLALDDLPQMDPPDATSYADVVGFDEPWGYWRLGEPEGTKAKANIIRGKKTLKRGGEKIRRKFKRRRGTIYSTREEVGAVSGPTGTYKNTPLLGQNSLIVGDSDTAVSFRASEDEWVRIPREDDDDLTGVAFTLEATVEPSQTGAQGDILTGPVGTGGGGIWGIRQTATQYSAFVVVNNSPTTVTASGGTPAVGTAAHIMATRTPELLSLYVDGVLVASAGTPPTITAPNSGGSVQIGSGISGANNFDGVIDEVAVYEYALTAERVAAHATAALDRGWPQQTAGERIADIATHALWSETGIQTAGRDVQPMFQHGQSRLETIAELAHAEGPRPMFWINGTGDPVYLGHEWQATSSAYNTVQGTFGDAAGEVDIPTPQLVYDNEVYNEVTVSHEAGEAVTVGDGLPPRRANTEWTDVLLVHHADVMHLANDVLAFYAEPQFRPVSVMLNDASAQRLNHILRRDIGHLVRVRKRGEGGTAIDRIANIIGVRKQLSREGHLTCQWTLGRGFNAADATWRLGITGYSELGQTTVLA